MAFEFLKTYDFVKNKIVIGSIVIGGFGDDGGIEYEPVSDIGEMAYGADGEATFSRQNIKGVVATITLKETSNSIPLLDALRKAQQLTRKIPPLNFNHLDTLTGDSVKSGYCVFKNWAAPSKSRNAGERTFVVELPYAADRIAEGPGNPIPL
jgi:hypothetical protein